MTYKAIMVQIVGYGSFLSAKNLSDKLGRRMTYKDFKKVNVYHYHRVFNIVPFNIAQWKDRGKDELAVMNVEKNEASHFNGVLFDVTEEEFQNLKMGAREYDTKEAEISDFDTHEKLGTAILFVGKKIFHGERIVDNSLMPVLEYIRICRTGAKNMGEVFLDQFESTTHLGNGDTLKDYLKDQILEKMDEKESK